MKDVGHSETEPFGSSKGHSFTKKDPSSRYLKSAADCTSPAVYYYRCVRCTEKGNTTYSYGSTASHVFSKKDTSSTYKKSDATCSSPAVYYYRCTGCTEKGTTTFTSGSTAAHSWGSWSTTKAATCTATGTKKRTCTKCGTTDTSTIPKIAHTGRNLGYL